MLTPIPLLIIPFAIFNILVFLTAGLEWNATVASFVLPSGASWRISIGDGFLAFALLILLFELMKATRASTRSIVDHFLALLLTGAAVAEFALVPQVANSIFALLIALMVVDFLTGLSASIRAPRPRVKAPKAPPRAKAEPAPPPEPAPKPEPTPKAEPTKTEPILSGETAARSEPADGAAPPVIADPAARPGASARAPQ